MTWGKSVLLTIPLVLSGIFAVPSPAQALTRILDKSDWASISAGEAHTCAIRVGRLYCWGNNESGQVGNGGDNRQDVADDIGDYSDWKSVTAGGAHTCAIRSTGYLYCWGNNVDGQLGTGTLAARTTPARVSTTYRDWKSVTAGGSHTCATRGVGYLYCWGNDIDAQLGNGATTGAKPSPVRVSTTYRDWKSVTAGGSHTCATRGIGYLYCWGDSSEGQLGTGTLAARTAPARVSTSYRDWKIVSAGGTNTCGTRGSGALYCWGDNTYGQVYDGYTTTRFLTPKRLFSTTADYRQTDAGGHSSCGIRGTGIAYCWGGTVASSYPPAGTDAPGEILELRIWKLQAPENTSAISGDPDEIKYGGNPDLLTYSNADYFHSNTANTAVYFRAETDGDTTGGSDYPRSELREMSADDPQVQASWDSTRGTHTMTIEQAITHLPGQKPEVVAGQIHDGGERLGGHGDVVMIRLKGSRLFVQGDGRDLGTLDSSYVLNEPFTVVITADSNGIDVEYRNQNGTAKTISNIAPLVNNKRWYFKAGCYTQANTSNGSGYGEVLMTSVTVTHS